MKSLFALLTLLLVSQAKAGFLFVTFRNGSDTMAEQVYFALSRDGQTWQALNRGDPMLVSTVGEQGARDPYLIRSHDGSRFYVIATDLSISRFPDWGRAVRAGSRSILVWESTDLVNWSAPRLVAVAPDDAGCTWAPEAVYDEATGDYLVFWASTSGSDNFSKHRIWACRTTDFVTFGAPFIYIERPTSTIIDTTIIHDGERYYRFSKDETYKAIAMETSEQLMGAWTTVSDFTLATTTGYEGPACYPLASGAWCLIADHYAVGAGYEPFVTTDLASGIFTPAPGFRFPFPFRHGSVLAISDEEYARLESALIFTSEAHLLFNEDSGTTAADSSGRGWHGTLVNGARWAAGRGGNAVSLDGVNDRVNLPTGVVSSFSDFTLSLWVKVNTLAAWSRIFDFGTGTDKYMFLTPRAGGSNAVRFALTTAGYNNEQAITGAAALPVGEWTHVAVTLQGGLGILYVNGEEVGRNSSMTLTPSGLGSTTRNWIGRSQFGSDPFFNGLVDDFRLSPAAASADEIHALYTGRAGAVPAPWLHQELGAPALAGSAGSAGAADADLVLTASGLGVQGDVDEGHLIHREWTGDGVLTARLAALAPEAAPDARAGIVVRDGLSESARGLFLGVDQAGNVSWQHRAVAGGGSTTSNQPGEPGASSSLWLRLARSGNVFTAYRSDDGLAWTSVGDPVVLALPPTLNLGLALSSGTDSTLAAARFADVACVAITMLDAYQQWKAAYGLALDVSNVAAPDGDGLPVLLKYALGLAPGATATSPVVASGEAEFGIVFPRLSPAPVRYVVQASSDLVTWTDIAVLAAGADAWTGAATVEEDTSATPRRVTVFAPAAGTEPDARRFLRLQVTNSAP